MSGQGLAALDYARRGWRVFPCHAPSGGACSCGAGDACASPAKHPRTRHGLHDASADEAVVSRWWRRWPAANVGIRTGAGLVVLDIDPAHGGEEALAGLEAAHGPLPATLAVRTGGAGLHLYFLHDAALRNSAGALGPGLDVRGDGGYVIAPPSWHASGSPYRWSTKAAPAPLPGWILQCLARPEPPRRGVEVPALRAGAGTSSWAAAALAGEVQRVASAPVGQRNHTLNRSAFVLGQIVGAGHLDHEEAADLLRRAGEAAGLGEPEAAATVASGLAAGGNWPRHPRPRPSPGARRPAPTARPGSATTEAAGDDGRAGVPETGAGSAGPSPLGAPASLEAFVDECAPRLWRPDGAEVRRWLTVARGLPEEVLSANRVGADLRSRSRSGSDGVGPPAPAAVVPVMEDDRVVLAELHPISAPAGRPRILRAGAPVPAVALVRPATPARPCVVVTAGLLDALAAGAAGFYGAAVLSQRTGVSDVDGVAERLRRLDAPVVLALAAKGPGAPAPGLPIALAERGVRVARLHLPADVGDLNGWMLRSLDWPRTLAAAMRSAWACEHRPRRLVR